MHMRRVHPCIGSQVLVQERRIRFERVQYIQHPRQWLVGNTNTLCRRFGSRQIRRRHGCQHGPTVQDLVSRKQGLVLEVTAKAVFWCIPGGQDRLDARQTLGLTGINGEHARMGMLTETQFPVEQAREVQIRRKLPTPEHLFKGINAWHRGSHNLPHPFPSFSPLPHRWYASDEHHASLLPLQKKGRGQGGEGGHRPGKRPLTLTLSRGEREQDSRTISASVRTSRYAGAVPRPPAV